MKGRKRSREENREERVFKERTGKREEGASLRRRVEWVRERLGVGDACKLKRRLDDFRQAKPALRARPRGELDRGEPLEKDFELRTAAKVGARAYWSERPEGKPTWGETGRYVRVTSRGAMGSGLLRYKLDPKACDHLVDGAVFAARWSEDEGRFRVIPNSGYNAEEGYVFGKISRPGIYTAIGLPRDPRIQTTLQLFETMRPWAEAAPELRQRLIDPICTVILCADWMQEAFADPKFLEGMGMSPGDFPGGFGGGNICEQCFGSGGPQLPEQDLLDVGGSRGTLVPGHTIGPAILVWPKPCPRWVNKGPRNVSGRIGGLAIHPSSGNTVFAGTTGGGVWRTTNSGGTWYPRMHDELSLAIGGVGISASLPRVLYAATGEWTGGIGVPIDPVTEGVGVYRTADSGGDWDLCAPIPSTYTAAVAVHPTDPDTVLVAGDRALHRSRDGGATWDIPTGMTHGLRDGETSDVVIDPNNASRVYIGVHNDGVYRSLNGGNSWTKLTNGIGEGGTANAPKIALGRNGTHGTNFVAVKMGDKVYTSINGGTSFTAKTDTTDGIWFFAWCNVIAVDPTDESILFAGGSNLYRSTNGGGAWTKVGGYGTNVHPDMQAVVFDPNNHDRVYCANDGGIWRSADNGQTWSFASQGLVATHVYLMGVSDTPTLRYGGAIQDDHGFAYKGLPDWSPLNLGEGGHLEYDPSDHQTIYHDAWFSQLNKSTDGGGSWNNLGIETDINYAESLTISRQNSDRLLVIRDGNKIARSTNGGTSFVNRLSPGTSLSAVRYAPSDDHHAYVGSNTGRVWHSDSFGQNWTELDTTALPGAKIQSIVVAWNDPRRVYVAFAGLGIRHLWRGDLDAGGNVAWFDVSGALPAVSLPDLPLTGLALHPTLEETIFVSTLLGVLRSVDGGDSWEPFDEGLPNAFVSDLDIRKRDRSLWASTMGRGVYRRSL